MRTIKLSRFHRRASAQADRGKWTGFSPLAAEPTLIRPPRKAFALARSRSSDARIGRTIFVHKPTIRGGTHHVDVGADGHVG